MAKDIIKNIPLTLDINARKRLNGTVDISLYSKDIATGQFEFTFIDEDGDPVVLDETYSAQALVKYEGSSKTYLNDMIIEGNIIRFIFPHDFITKDGTITMYIYVTKDNYTSDVAAISFPVFVSEIDKDLDPSVSVHYIGKIEQLIEDMRNEIDDQKQVLLDEIMSNTDVGNINNYHQQFTDVIAELSREKDYHSLPEIAGARRGYSTLAESLQNLSASMINPNLGKLTQIHMSDELLSQIAGDTAVNAVPADGSITREKLANNSVGQEEIDSSSTISPNILDLEPLSTGRFMYAGAGSTVALSTGSNWRGHLQGIPVTAGDIVRFNMAYMNAYFVGVNDQDLVLQVGPVRSTVGDTEIIVETGVTKFYTAVFHEHLSEAMITINQPMPDTYMPFGNTMKKIQWLEVDETNIEDGAITPEKISDVALETSVNIFDKDTAIHGEYYSAVSGGPIALKQSINWYRPSEPVKVKAGDVVRFNTAHMTVYYIGLGDDDIAIQIGSWVDGPGFSEMTVAEGVTRFWYTIYAPVVDEAMVTVNNPMPSEYVPHMVRKTAVIDWLDYKPKSITVEALSDDVMSRFSNNPSPNDPSIVSDWEGKTFVSNGTSISWQDGRTYSGTQDIARGYQTVIKEKLGFSSYLNVGESGKAMADGTANGSGIVSTGLKVNYTSHALAIIEAGTNDFKLNVQLGEIGSVGDENFDRTTFYGAYRTLIEYTLTQNPNIRLVLFTPLQRDNGGYNGWDFVNTAGHTLDDYRKAIFSLGEMYGLPVCDLYANSGFNKFTLSTFTRDGLHPIDVGYARMGGYAAQFINNVGL